MVLLGIVDKLLDVVRVQPGRMIAYDCTSGDLWDLIRQAIAIYRQVSKGHEFCLVLPPGEGEDCFDGSKVQSRQCW